jgi:DNA polymerase elongation subunit (family B)
MTKPKIVLLDTETSPVIVTTFSLYPESINHNNILQDWYIICACWKELGSKTVSSSQAKKPGDDKQVCKDLAKAITDADIIVAHNGKKFDIKKLNARLIYHGLDPIPQVPMVDTLLEVKKVAQFTSHRLDYLGKHLLGEGKVQTSEGLWLRALKGDKKAIKEMVKYCIGDVNVLEKLYNRLKPYFKTHPHAGILSNMGIMSCPKCGSAKTQKRGVAITTSGVKYQRLQCQDCGSWHQISLSKVK